MKNTSSLHWQNLWRHEVHGLGPLNLVLRLGVDADYFQVGIN